MLFEIMLVLCIILLIAAVLFFKGPAILDLAADFSAAVVYQLEKSIKAALKRWQDILEE